MSEVLLALAEEIRQTLSWLGQEDEPPSASNLRFRIRTLREAASMAHMNAVETVLAELEARLEADQQGETSAEPGGLEEVLRRLSGLIVSLAEPAEAYQMQWVGQVDGAQEELHRLGAELAEGADRLGQLTRHCDRAALAESAAERTEELIELARSLRRQVEKVNEWRREVGSLSDRLHQVGRALMREISLVHRVPLEPTFARLRERVRRYGRANSRPCSLRCRAGRLEVGAGQFEPLGRVLDRLIDHVLDHGLFDPASRRKLGKPTVATVDLQAEQRGSLLEVRISDDGPEERPTPALAPEVREDLRLLRARLLVGQAEGAGQELILQLPMWYSSLEVLPVHSVVGEILVPLNVVDRIHNHQDGSEDSIPLIDLERRAREGLRPATTQGLVCALGAWRGFLPTGKSGPVSRAIVRPAGTTDPGWVMARVDTGEKDLPVFHPLHFLGQGDGQTCLFPREGDS